MGKSGYIYILRNRRIPDLVKIGRTKRLPEKRALEISGREGIPVPYQVAWDVKVKDCIKMERLVHQKLNYCRENPNREFFEISISEAKRIIKSIIQQEGASFNSLTYKPTYGSPPKNYVQSKVTFIGGEKTTADRKTWEKLHPSISNIKVIYIDPETELLNSHSHKNKFKNKVAKDKELQRLVKEFINRDNTNEYREVISTSGYPINDINHDADNSEKLYNWGKTLVKYPDMAIDYMARASKLGHPLATTYLNENLATFQKYLERKEKSKGHLNKNHLISENKRLESKNDSSSKKKIIQIKRVYSLP